MEDKVISALKTFAYSINSSSEAAADMSELIEATSQLSLSSFDYWERMIRSEFSTAIRVSTPPKWKVWLTPTELVTWMDLISWDGYKREEALHVLSGAAPNTFFFAFAVRRLNDWVPQVRKAAREKLPRIAKSTDPEYVAEALCVVLSSWNSWGRIEESGKDVLLDMICVEEVAKSLRSKLMLSASGPMPSIFSQLGRTLILDGRIEEVAQLAIQPAVRAKAYRSLFEQRIVWVEARKWVWTDLRYCKGRFQPIVGERKLAIETPLLDLLEKSSGDRSSIVRRVSAEMLIRELGNIGIKFRVFAERFASDNSYAVSERGKFALRQLDEVEYDGAP